MISLFKKIFAMETPTSDKTPLKYREYQYTLAELERRLNAEVQGYGSRY